MVDDDPLASQRRYRRWGIGNGNGDDAGMLLRTAGQPGRHCRAPQRVHQGLGQFDLTGA